MNFQMFFLPFTFLFVVKDFPLAKTLTSAKIISLSIQYRVPWIKKIKNTRWTKHWNPPANHSKAEGILRLRKLQRIWIKLSQPMATPSHWVGYAPFFLRDTNCCTFSFWLPLSKIVTVLDSLSFQNFSWVRNKYVLFLPKFSHQFTNISERNRGFGVFVLHTWIINCVETKWKLPEGSCATIAVHAHWCPWMGDPCAS